MATIETRLIPDELFEMEILKRLPVKSLKRFNCVCKSWYAFVKNPNFITAHSIFQQKNNARVVVNRSTKVSPCEWNFLCEETLQLEKSVLHLQFLINSVNGVSNIRIVGSGSVNGIICMLLNRSRLVLLNPATREAKTLDEFVVSVYEGFGFGYDNIINEYKVVRTGNGFAEVYNVASNCWRKLDADVYWQYNLYTGDLFLNGMYHWIGKRKHCKFKEEFLISFDMSTELFYKTDMPFLDNCSRRVILRIYSVKDSIAVITCTVGLGFQVWILGGVEAKESWTMQFTIDDLRLSGLEFPIGFGKNSEILFLTRCRYDQQADVLLYNHNSKTLRKLGFQMQIMSSATAMYSESLYSFF